MSQEIANTSASNPLIAIGNLPGNSITTIDMTKPGASDAVYNALTAPTCKLSSMIGKTIKIKDVYAENIEGVNEDTGEVEAYTMIVIFDVEGKTYICSSSGIKNALRRAFGLFGSPTWENGLEFEVMQIETPRGRTFTLRRTSN